MPLLPRAALAAFTLLLVLPGLSPAQDSVGIQVIRTDEFAVLDIFVLNLEENPRDFLLTAEENGEPGWLVFYLQNGLDDLTAQIVSPSSIILSVPPAPDALHLQVVFLPDSPAQGSVKTVTITATPEDGMGDPQVAELRVRLLDEVIVNDDRDLEDVVPDNEFIDVDPAQPGEQITLRAAIEFCNDRPGFDAIHFNLPGPDLPRLLPLSPLPVLSDPVVIDGSTQPNAGPQVGVEISGEAIPAALTTDGLVVTGGGSTLRGLAINRFRAEDFGVIPGPELPNPSGVVLSTNGGNTIESCLLGLDPAGTSGAGNEGYGIRIHSPDNVIDDCTISGNWVGGVGIFNASGNRVTASVGASLDKSASSNFLDAPVSFDGLPFSPLGAAPDFAVLDANLANAGLRFTTLNETAAWESVAAGFLGGIVVHEAPDTMLIDCCVQGNGADGIRFLGDCRNSRVQGGTIGRPFGGHTSLANAGHGIALTGDRVTVADSEITGNLASGILVRGVDNELVGVTSARNGGSGIRCEGRGTTIGGDLLSGLGQIFANAGAGIRITEPPGPVPYTPGSNRVLGNLIGLEAPFGVGTLNRRPNLRGIHIDGGQNNLIDAATIAYNHFEGILITTSTQNSIAGATSVFNNRADIDLSATLEGDGIDLSDPGDADTGGNNKSNAPTLTGAVQTEAGLEVTGTMQPGLLGGYVLEFLFYDARLPLSVAQSSERQTIEAIAPDQPFTINLPLVQQHAGFLLRATLTDPEGNTSEYSPWIRVEGETHTDTDGVSDEVETLAPSRPFPDPGDPLPPPGDGNGDTTPDAEQDHVVSLPLLAGGYLTLSTTPGQSILKATETSTDKIHRNSTIHFPLGMWSFRVGAPAGRATVTVQFPTDGMRASFYNFGPTPDNPAPHWYEFLFDGTTGAEILGNRVILHFVDGQRGDHDLTVNGVIVTDGGSVGFHNPIPNPEFSLLSDQSVVISWWDSGDPLLLEETTLPGSGPWRFTAEPQIDTDSRRAVRVTPDQGTELFRLMRP